LFFAQLREARQQFEQGEENGRIGAFTALAATWMFILAFKATSKEPLFAPIVMLQNALAALDQGLVLPIVKPIRRRGRARSDEAYASLKGHAAATVKILLQTGLDHQQACRRVATQLARLGVRPERGSGTVTATTVRNWCVEVSRDVHRRRTAAQAYDHFILDPKEKESLLALPKDWARQFVLQSLADWVRALFPKRQKNS
jgi:hypothetical protein